MEPGDYLTDGAELWRFEMFLPNEEGVMLENCWSGFLITRSLEQFAKMKLYTLEAWRRDRGDD